MKPFVDEARKKPAYLQLYEKLRTDILEGVYAYGTKAPSKRIMAAEAGLSLVTVEHAYSLLCEEGYLEARPRSGYIVVFKASDGFSGGGAPVLHEKERTSGARNGFSVFGDGTCHATGTQRTG